MSEFTVEHGDQFRVLAPQSNPKPRILGQGEPPTYYEYRSVNENGAEKVCRDHHGDILTASSYVDYPFGTDQTKRHVDYIRDNQERFEKIITEPEPLNEEQ